MQHINREAAVRLLIPAGALKQIPVLTLEWFSPFFQSSTAGENTTEGAGAAPKEQPQLLGRQQKHPGPVSQQEFPAAEAWLGLELRRGCFAGPLE